MNLDPMAVLEWPPDVLDAVLDSFDSGDGVMDHDQFREMAHSQNAAAGYA